ncbi:MAG: nuclear transport factor 2 family protein [Myxococcales bacterium]|nr:nuclear transport factor 2 family protein [Myxococcales bacterium]
MSSRDHNLATVQTIYAAFGRGDVPTILGTLSDDVDWETGGLDHGIPWLRPGRGRQAVVRFFESLGALEFEHFEPHTLLADDRTVVALCHLRLRVKATGKTIVESSEPHIWTFGPDGRVAAFRHAADTAQHRDALRA